MMKAFLPEQKSNIVNAQKIDLGAWLKLLATP